MIYRIEFLSCLLVHSVYRYIICVTNYIKAVFCNLSAFVSLLNKETVYLACNCVCFHIYCNFAMFILKLVIKSLKFSAVEICR